MATGYTTLFLPHHTSCMNQLCLLAYILRKHEYSLGRWVPSGRFGGNPWLSSGFCSHLECEPKSLGKNKPDVFSITTKLYSKLNPSEVSSQLLIFLDIIVQTSTLKYYLKYMRNFNSAMLYIQLVQPTHPRNLTAEPSGLTTLMYLLQPS